MKPAKFDYYRASSVEQALDLLEQHGYDAKILAGGQSLVPAMNFRLAQPSILVDLNFVSDLGEIREDRKKGIVLGTMTRHRTVERSSLIAQKVPLLHETMPFIAHPQIRNRGTVGGSIVHADPAAELPAVMIALNASFHVKSRKGERWIDAQDFFTGMFSTAMEPEDMLLEIAIPQMPKRYGYAFSEVARRHGDYALVGVATSLVLDRKGRCEDAKIVFLSVGDAPILAKLAGEQLKGQAYTEELIKEVALTASQQDIDPGSDIHGSSQYRRHLANILTQKTLRLAFERANK